MPAVKYPIVVGLLVFVASSILATLAIVGLSGSLLTAPVALTALFSGAMVGIFLGIKTKQDASPYKLQDIIMGTVWCIVSARAFLWLVYWSGGQLKILSPYNLGDLSLHIHLIEYLASGIKFWPESPILMETPLKYPLGMNLFNSLLLLVNIPLVNGLIITGLVGALVMGYTIWKWAGAFGLAAFLFAGGLTGFQIFTQHELLDWQGKAEWKNAFLTMVVTQRGFLYAIPAGILLLCQWRKRLEGSPVLMPWPAEIILYTSMPIFSAHTFLFLSLVLFLAFVFGANTRLLWFGIGAISVPIASTLLACITGGFNTKGSIHMELGWMQHGNPWVFWILNFGIMIPLLAAVYFIGFKPKTSTPATRTMLGASLITSIACVVVSFAPWPWDNTKLMIWAWIAAIPFIWELVLSKLRMVYRIPILLALFFTGIISLYAGLDHRHSYGLASRQEIAEAKNMIIGLPRDTRIICSPTYNHPLGLAGHKLLAGYDGHLFSHGLDYQKTYQKVESILRGEPGWKDKALVLGARYLYWGNRENEKYPTSSKPWENEATCIHIGETGKLYRLW